MHVTSIYLGATDKVVDENSTTLQLEDQFIVEGIGGQKIRYPNNTKFIGEDGELSIDEVNEYVNDGKIAGLLYSGKESEITAASIEADFPLFDVSLKHIAPHYMVQVSPITPEDGEKEGTLTVAMVSIDTTKFCPMIYRFSKNATVTEQSKDLYFVFYGYLKEDEKMTLSIYGKQLNHPQANAVAKNGKPAILPYVEYKINIEGPEDPDVEAEFVTTMSMKGIKDGGNKKFLMKSLSMYEASKRPAWPTVEPFPVEIVITSLTEEAFEDFKNSFPYFKTYRDSKVIFLGKKDFDKEGKVKEDSIYDIIEKRSKTQDGKYKSRAIALIGTDIPFTYKDAYKYHIHYVFGIRNEKYTTIINT